MARVTPFYDVVVWRIAGARAARQTMSLRAFRRLRNRKPLRAGSFA